ncbi:helix-turn-helix transcriptional regulator [Tepidibacter hydrothermalis]|uniref:YafY family protein n=1 Tax=Tepidibacter hydrothermalis TaxID=3036126 RepID=A0ABY8ECN1_9FIRM|nr:YafY family protein [Tepidibacter hydrothermalis]WFD10674.1 YafY family protein [Tepidibacter hydrothermalis]
MQIDRLFKIIFILLNKDTVTAKELSERFEVSTRTIYRDIDKLSSAGIPIYTSKGSGGGISLLDNFTLNKSLISENEQNEILLGLESLKLAKYPNIESLISKLNAVFKSPNNYNWIDIDFSHWGSEKDEHQKFTDIKSGIINHNIIIFEYISSYGKKTFRRVEPLRLVFKSKTWYLQAFCTIKQDFRTFRISRMKKIKVINETFERILPDDFPIGYATAECNLIVTLKLRFNQQMEYRVYDEFDENYITKNNDGSFNIEVSFPENEWVYGYIMSFGYFVEVLEPKHIRDIIKDRLNKAIEQYN